MKIIICLLLLIFIPAAFQATVWCLDIRRNLETIEQRVKVYGYEAGKMKDVVDWFQNVPTSKKVWMVNGG